MAEQKQTIPGFLAVNIDKPIDDGSELGPDGNQEDILEELVRGVAAEDLNENTLDDLIDQHPDMRTDMIRLVSLRKSGKASAQERELVDTIKNKRDEIGRQIKEKLGIVEENPEEEERRLELERLHRLGSILMTLTRRESDDELLIKFGLVSEDGKMSEESMDSPLFRTDTRQAFNAYLDEARKYDQLEKAEGFAGHRLINTIEANQIRYDAHNLIARLVERDLGLPFDSARRFVAKARDAVTPGLQEKVSYAELARGEKLAEKYGRDALALTSDTLKSIIEIPMDHERK